MYSNVKKALIEKLDRFVKNKATVNNATSFRDAFESFSMNNGIMKQDTIPSKQSQGAEFKMFQKALPKCDIYCNLKK